MTKIILLLALLPNFALASAKPVDPYCAKANLSAIYGAEKSYHSEYEVYASTFKEIGFEQTDPKCNEWELDVRVVGGGQEFLATAKHPQGEEWTINEKKELRKIREAN